MMRKVFVEHHIPCGTGAMVLKFPLLECEECGSVVGFNHKGFDSEGHHISTFNFCPFCGTKARGE